MDLGLSWSWSYGSWIYDYMCNRCLLPIKLWVRTPSWRGVLDTKLCDKVCQWHATGRRLSLGTSVFFTNKTNRLENGVEHHKPIPEYLVKNLPLKYHPCRGAKANLIMSRHLVYKRTFTDSIMTKSLLRVWSLVVFCSTKLCEPFNYISKVHFSYS